MYRIAEWLRQAEAFLDRYGRGAWIAASLAGFFVAWPLGAALLLYVFWSGRMSKIITTEGARRWQVPGPKRSSGNSAFDEYREETLRRLEEERSAFEGFLERLRKARDRAEFEQFMEERQRGATMPQAQAG